MSYDEKRDRDNSKARLADLRLSTFMHKNVVLQQLGEKATYVLS
jgi:hypothetical protein